MAVPKVPTFNDWHFELVNLATGSFTNLDQSIVAISGWVGPGASRHRLESAHLEIIDGSVGAIALSWAGIQLLRIVPYADPTHELWGYISKDRHAYSKSGHRDSIKVTVLPIEYLLHSRIVYETDNAAAAPVAIATEAAPNNTGGDYAKTLLTACTHGRYPTAAAADTRDWAWGTLFVAAQVHDGSPVAPPMSIIGGFLDEAINALGQTYAFDWELYVAVVAGVVQFTFTTADAGGTDLTAGANRVIINDIGALVPSAERYFDREGMINAMHGGSITTAVLDAPEIATWGRWEGETQTSVDEELALVLNMSGIKEGSTFEFQASAASIQCQWMDEYEVGDTVKRNNIRLGIADSNEIIRGIEFSFKQRVLETRVRWGNKEPGDKEKGRQGRYTPFPPVPPTLWSRHAASAYLYPTTLGDDVRLKDAAGVDMLTMDGATGSQSWADAAQMTWESIVYRMPLVAPATGEALIATAGVPNQLSWGVPASSYWERGDLDSGAGVTTGLFTRFAGDPVMIGADNADLTATPWVGTSGGTKLDVRGLLRVVRGVYCNEASLALWGITGGVPIVHIVDESAAVGGAGGGACQLDVYNAAVRHHMFDADIARASYVRGFFEIHDAAGAIGHTFNAVTGVVTLNVQRLAGGDFSALAQAGGVTILGTDANTRNLILNNVPHLWPAADAAGALLSDGAGTLSWGLAPPAAHDILSASHGDTLAAGVIDGDVIIGNVTPAWSRLAIAIPGAGTRNVLGIDNAELRPSWKTAVYSVALTLPGEFNVAGSPITGTGTLAGTWVVQNANLVFSGPAAGAPAVPTFRALVAADIVGISDPGTCTVATANAVGPPHTHAITTSSNPGAAAAILASDANGYLQLVGLGVGSGATAANRVVYGANGAYIDGPDATFLRYDAPVAHLWNVGGANELVLRATELYPVANNDIILGRAATRYGNIYSILGNFSGRVTLGAASYIEESANDAKIHGADDVVLDAVDDILFYTATVLSWKIDQGGVLHPVGNNAFQFGAAGSRPTVVYSVLGNFSGDVSLWSGADLNVYDGAPGNLKASIDGATGLIDSVFGYTVGGGAANRHVMIGDGAKCIIRALVAADLGGHVHVNTFGVVASAPGALHTHVMVGATGVGSAHTHSIAGHTTGWVTYGSVCLTGNPVRDSAGNIVYLRTFANAADAANDVNATGEIAYIGATGHYHEYDGTSGGCTTIAATAAPIANESAHTHPIGTITAGGEAAHTHNYQKTVTPTQGPS